MPKYILYILAAEIVVFPRCMESSRSKDLWGRCAEFQEPNLPYQGIKGSVREIRNFFDLAQKISGVIQIKGAY
jgi:hypothetical protein